MCRRNRPRLPNDKQTTETVMQNRLGHESHNRSAMRRFLPKYLYTLARAPYLFTVGVFSPAHRSLIFHMAKHLGMEMHTEDEKLPQEPLSAILKPQLDLTLLEP